MNKFVKLCFVAIAALGIFSCTPEPIVAPVGNAQGTFNQDLGEVKSPVPFQDCNGNALNLVSGKIHVNYNVVANANATNATAHLLLSNLKFESSDGNVYSGVFDTKVSARAGKGESLNFDLKFRVSGKGGSAIAVRVRFRVTMNGNNTATADQISVEPTCDPTVG